MSQELLNSGLTHTNSPAAMQTKYGDSVTMTQVKVKDEPVMINNPKARGPQRVRRLRYRMNPEPDMNGDIKPNPIIEFTVMGVRGEHRDFLYYDDFKRHNPTISV